MFRDGNEICKLISRGRARKIEPNSHENSRDREFSLCSGMRSECGLDALFRQSGCNLDAIWMQCGCNVDAVWMRSGCGLDAVWMRSGCGQDTVWMQSKFGLKEFKSSYGNHKHATCFVPLLEKNDGGVRSVRFYPGDVMHRGFCINVKHLPSGLVRRLFSLVCFVKNCEQISRVVLFSLSERISCHC